MHTVCTLVPSHEYPAGHASQLVRVVLLPPDVNDPVVQMLQLLEPAALLYWSSPPQVMHSLEPATAKYPAEHATTTLVPSHAEPAGHAMHVTFAIVKEPSGHIAQLLSPLTSLYDPLGQGLQSSSLSWLLLSVVSCGL